VSASNAWTSADREPQELYRRCDDEQRRLLNQALFEGLYIDHDEVAGHELREPFALLHRAQHSWQTDKPDPGATTTRAAGSRRTVPIIGNGPSATQSVEALLAGLDLVQGSNKTPRVGLMQHNTNREGAQRLNPRGPGVAPR
jgi:site-specific DNA recombinase